MRNRIFVVWVTLIAFMVASPVWAEQHVADQSAISQALADKQATDAATRALVEQMLDRSDVQTAAKRMGLDVGTAKTAVAAMSSEDLAVLAQPATAAADDLAGGSTTVITISLTTLLLIIIVILLIAR